MSVSDLSPRGKTTGSNLRHLGVGCWHPDVRRVGMALNQRPFDWRLFEKKFKIQHVWFRSQSVGTWQHNSLLIKRGRERHWDTALHLESVMMPEFTTSWRQPELGRETFTAVTASPSKSMDARYWQSHPPWYCLDEWLSIRNARNARNFNPTWG